MEDGDWFTHTFTLTDGRVVHACVNEICETHILFLRELVCAPKAFDLLGPYLCVLECIEMLCAYASV